MGMVPLSGSEAWGIDGNDYSCTGFRAAGLRDLGLALQRRQLHVLPGTRHRFADHRSACRRVWVLTSAAVYAATGTGLHRIASPGRAGMFPQIAASPSGQLWLLVVYGSSAHKPDLLRSWNGHSWTRRNVPAKAQKLSYGSSGGFTWDGSHGVWLGPYTHWTRRRWILPHHARGADDSLRAPDCNGHPAISQCLGRGHG